MKKKSNVVRLEDETPLLIMFGCLMGFVLGICFMSWLQSSQKGV